MGTDRVERFYPVKSRGCPDAWLAMQSIPPCKPMGVFVYLREIPYLVTVLSMYLEISFSGDPFYSEEDFAKLILNCKIECRC